MSSAEHRLNTAKHAIAAAYLDALPEGTLGSIVLRDDQRRTVARARRSLARHGGCLIADDVGRGKTFVALALARAWTAPVVVAPAGLRETWLGAMAQARVPCQIVSHEALSRGHAPIAPFDGILVDESHHFRNVATRRYGMLADLASRVPIVMLSATPLQNRTRDLAAQIALFLGERAFAKSAEALATMLIRSEGAVEGMPELCAPEWIDIEGDDEEVLRRILDLPPPAPALDSGDAGALRLVTLVRAWASSRAALRTTLRRRMRSSTAIEQGLEVGRVPTRREARAWHGTEHAVQLGFAPLLIDARPTSAHTDAVRARLRDDIDATGAVLSALRFTDDPDHARVRALRAIRSRHPDARIIAFSEFAGTVAAYYAALSADAHVAMLTASEGRIASGRLARSEVLARFAPRAQQARAVPAHESVTLLLTTDLLSEGVNLQDASVIVHLDLPWNPARMAQRVGRARRPGGAAQIHVYALAPPARSSALLGTERLLRHKLTVATAVVGQGFEVLPMLTRSTVARAVERSARLTDAGSEGALIDRLARWIRDAPSGERSTPITAAVAATEAGWLAALDDGRLLACIDDVPDAGATVRRAAVLVDGDPRLPRDDELCAAFDCAKRWCAMELVVESCGLGDAPGPLHAAMERWVRSLARAIPRHQQVTATHGIARLRRSLAGPLPLGLERALAAVAARTRSLDEVVTLLPAAGSAERQPTATPRMVAMIVFGPESPR